MQQMKMLMVLTTVWKMCQTVVNFMENEADLSKFLMDGQLIIFNI